jgi:hypothetical protein
MPTNKRGVIRMKNIWVDWSRPNIDEEWDCIGATKIREHAEVQIKRLKKLNRISQAEKICPDDLMQSNMPIYDIAYPLHSTEISDKKIIKVCSETNCTVIQNNFSGKYCLSLSACGMDYSQDIALAYIIIDGCIDWDFLNDVYIESPISVSQKKFKSILRELRRQLKISIQNYTAHLNRVESHLKFSNTKRGII